MTHEREITESVDLCLPDGTLNPNAVGWTRQPLHRANLRGWGRCKRWEYWCVTTPTHLLAITVSTLDYLAMHSVWFLEFGGLQFMKTAIVPLGLGLALPERSAGGDIRVETRSIAIELLEGADGTRLRARAKGFEADVLARRPVRHESLGVVIPWSDRRFQYTVKDNTRPAEGFVRVGTRVFAFESATAWAALDHGRGAWPYRTVWNWGAGSGRLADGRSIGLQLGGKWTDGTGFTENALCLDGRLSKLGETLEWTYARSDWRRPWRVSSPSRSVDLTFEPFHVRRDRVELVVAGTEVHQCIGHWSGTVIDEREESIEIRNLLGWAEEARMRW